MIATKQILIVDDEESIRESLAAILETKGYSVFKAKDGQEAFHVFKSNPSINLIISDIRMPNADGEELLKLVQELRPQFPVVLMTGYSDSSDAELLKKGAVVVLLKPFRIKNLLEYIEQITS